MGQKAYVGIDVAFAKRKRLPIVACVRQDSSLQPLPLRPITPKPPQGQGNARILDEASVIQFAEETAEYLKRLEQTCAVEINRIAIDAPSAPRCRETKRRHCEAGLDERKISCISTPSAEQFAAICKGARTHLAFGGSEACIPAANQLWMIVGFALFKHLRREWECLEVYPQAIVATLNAKNIHKREREGYLAQLRAVAARTGWPTEPSIHSLSEVGYGSSHDRLDAYMSAWIASLDELERVPIGHPPDDVIWVPR